MQTCKGCNRELVTNILVLGGTVLEATTPVSCGGAYCDHSTVYILLNEDYKQIRLVSKEEIWLPT
jgi:hypothetical protein